MSSDKLIVALLALLNVSMMPFLLRPDLSYLSYLLLFILLLSFGFFAHFLFKSPLHSVRDRLDRLDYLFLLILLVLSFSIGLRYLNSFSLWLDEYEEGRNVLYYVEILQRAAEFQQPPLGYYLRKIGLILFGETETGLRSASLGAYVVNISAIYLTVKKISKDSVFSFFSTLFLTFNIILIALSAEARPYSISLMYSSFLFYGLADYFFPDQAKPGFPHFFLIFIMFFWLMSISMQPLFFILLLFIFSLVIGVVRKQKRWLCLSGFSFAALVLFFPFALKILEKSTRYLNSEIAIHKIYSKQVLEIIDLFFRLFLRNEFYEVVAYQILSIFILSLFFSKRRYYLILFLAFAICFVLSIFSFMILKVNWGAPDRYFVTAVPLFYLIFFAAFYFILDGKYIKVKNFCLALMALTITFSYSKAVPLKYFYHDWRGLYSFLDQTSIGQSKAFVFSYPAKGKWVDEYFVASEYYPTSKVEIKSMRDFAYPQYTTYDDLHETMNKKDLGEFFFVIMARTLNAETFEKINITGVEKFPLRDFYVFHSLKETSLRHLANEFFLQINEADPNLNKFVRTYEGLFLLSLAENKCKDAEKYLKMWQPIAENYDEKLVLRIRHHNQLIAKQCN